MHSPFVFDLIETVLRDKINYPEYADRNWQRKRLLGDQTYILLSDLGAGSKKPAAGKRVCDIARTSVQPKKYQELLFRLIRKYQPKTILELGTSLGLTTNYLADALPEEGKLYTLEGDPNILAFASEEILARDKNIVTISGNFDDTLPELLQKLGKIDMIYIDGNHTYEATVRYFKLVLPYLSEKAIVVFDDIYWSEGMLQAWNEVIAHEGTQLSLDLFKLGIVFVEKAKVKQHFILRY